MQLKLAYIASNAATALVVLAIGSVLSVGAAYWTAGQLEREARVKFETDVSDAKDAIERRIQAYADVLHGVRGLFSASDSISRDAFRRYVSSLELDRRYPGIQVVTFNRRVPFVQKRDFETTVRRDTSLDPNGYPNFAIKPPGDRAEYYVVDYLEPWAGNEEAFGLDAGGDPVRLASVERARDSGQLAASGRITLVVLGDTGHAGFVLRLPIYRNGMPHQTVAQRHQALVGLIASSYRMDYLMQGALGEPLLQKIHLRIHDAGYPDSPHGLQPRTAENLMFDSSGVLKTEAARKTLNIANSENTPLSKTLSLDVGGRRWDMNFSARQGVVSPSDRWLPLAAMLGGITISLLLFGLMRMLATSGSRAIELAERITDNLRKSEASLAEAQRRTQELIEVLPNPIYFKGTDGRYLGVNQAWEKFFGMPRNTFIGKTVHDLYPDNPEVAERLHRDDQALWNRPGSQSYETSIITPDGQRHVAIYYKATFARADGSVAGLIGTIVDITERKELEQRYREIFELAPVGIARTSLDGQYLQVNHKYAEMLGCSMEEFLTMSPQDFIHPHERAGIEQDRKKMLNGEISNVTGERRFVRKDRRVIWANRTLSLARDPAGQPIYFIGVVEDITESKEREGRYRAMFENAAVGITRVDLNGVLVDINQKFCDMLGYTRDEMIGKAIKDITHPEDYGQGAQFRGQVTHGEMKEAIGEKRFVRKDGTTIWARRTMSIVRDNAGSPQYVISVVEDITEHKQAELQQALEHTVTRLLSEADRSSGIMSKIIQTIGEAFGCAYGAYWSEDEHEQVMACAETWSVPSAEIMEFAALNRQFRHPLQLPGGLFMRVRHSGEPIWINDVTQDASFRRASHAAKAGLHGAFAFPIRSGNDTLGVMEFFSRTSRPPSEMLLQSTRSIGRQIGLFIARKQAEERIRHLAHYDELTGLANRNMFSECLNHALAQARRNDKPLAILFIDLDRFKNINDTLGHEAGDRVLKEVAERLLGCLRASDTVGRLGGDEFVVLLEELPQPLHVAAVAQKILAAVAKPYMLEAQEFHLTASIGISTYPADSDNMQSLLKNADIAMYRAKEQGKNNYQYYSAQMYVHSLERLELDSDLRRALERKEFLLHYQPRIDIVSGRITGMEALVRWQHPTKGLIPPMQFIPLAEETGLIVPIGEWVLKTACARNKSWQEQGLPPLRIAVNLSARQFAHENLLQDVSRVLDETGLNPAALEFEITESMVMHNPEHAVNLLTRLKAMGIHLAIDDFGTGYSSLSYLKRFPLDSVKIDRSFIRDLPRDADDAAITRAIIAMAHSLRLEVIAEGVETEEQLHFLRDHGCDEMQGYYFSEPVPEHEFVRLVHAGSAAGAAFSIR